jgi:hypothetical protein
MRDKETEDRSQDKGKRIKGKGRILKPGARRQQPE